MAVTITGNTRVIGQTTVGVVNPPLLDTYSGAAAAYSLRKLRTAYTGNAIRVRRSSDNIEQNIGFNSNGDLDKVSLLSFVGANSGFVTTWYDQSGNARNATQTDTAKQPRIVNSGTIDIINNSISLNFNGTSSALATNSQVLSNSNFSIFSVIKASAQNNTALLAQHSGAAVTGRTIFLASDFNSPYDKIRLFFNNGTSYNVTSSTVAFNNTIKLIYSQSNGSGTSLVGVNGTTEGTLTGQTWTPLNTQLRIGCIAGFLDVDGPSGFYNGNVSEIIIYTPNQSSNRTAIEQNINAYYNIY